MSREEHHFCLRCQGKGHIRRDYRAPRCTSACRHFEHEEGQCVRSCATVVRLLVNEDSFELLVDEGDAEEAATAGKESGTSNATATKLPANTTPATHLPECKIEPEGDHGAEDVAVAKDAEVASAKPLPDASNEESEVMVTESTALTTNSQVAWKRCCRQIVEGKPSVSSDE
ncbi:hypothetical protein HPB50_014417 [Hyalomma asiaticum]|uniref:Uncharacterized protein n=1 Tax=Hyalomma asiaticum TaxID=266040 RepID=A0ACB7RM96_HYAAI|nr:hypothetical protein HPB50_014417 [Hyalomma asiaticum]